MRIATGEIEDTPMAAGITDKLWSVADLAEMVDASLPVLGPRGPYKKMVLPAAN